MPTQNKGLIGLPSEWTAVILNKEGLDDFRKRHVDHGFLTAEKVYEEYNRDNDCNITHEMLFNKCQEIDPNIWLIVSLNRLWKCECGFIRVIFYNDEVEWQIKNIMNNWLRHHFGDDLL